MSRWRTAVAGWPSIDDPGHEEPVLDDPTYQDRELVQALQAHLSGALPLVFERYGPQLFDYCHALLRDQEAASLALHDTFLIVRRTPTGCATRASSGAGCTLWLAVSADAS